MPMECLVGPLVFSAPERPCSMHYELRARLPEGCESLALAFLRFRNYYCARVIVKQYAGSGDEWVTVLDREIMRDMNCEEDAQAYVVVDVREDFNDRYRQDAALPLRLYLVQPSVMWERVELHDIRMFATHPRDRRERLPPEAQSGAATSPSCLRHLVRLASRASEQGSGPPAAALQRAMEGLQLSLRAAVSR